MWVERLNLLGNRVDLRISRELLSYGLDLVLILIEIVPDDTKTSLMLVPVDGKQSSPDTHDNGEQSIQWGCLRILEEELVENPKAETNDGWEDHPS
jgi:hypothetical protein